MNTKDRETIKQNRRAYASKEQDVAAKQLEPESGRSKDDDAAPPQYFDHYDTVQDRVQEAADPDYDNVKYSATYDQGVGNEQIDPEKRSNFKYSGVDPWQPGTRLKNGDYVFQLSSDGGNPGESEYYFSTKTLNASTDGDSVNMSKLRRSLQVGPGQDRFTDDSGKPQKGQLNYRSTITIYRVVDAEKLQGESSTSRENEHFGSGGGEQFKIHDEVKEQSLSEVGYITPKGIAFCDVNAPPGQEKKVPPELEGVSKVHFDEAADRKDMAKAKAYLKESAEQEKSLER